VKMFKFDCKGSNAPAYSCSEPYDNSGWYVKATELKKLYVAVNMLVRELTAKGAICAKDHRVDDVSDALFDFDEGQYRPELFDD